MEALAGALREEGAEVALRAADDPLEADVVVLDSYRWRADDPTRVRARTVAALEDHGRDLAVDLLVDPSPGAADGSHPSAKRVLLGARYALVGPSLPPPPDEDAPTTLHSVLVSLGGDDRAGHGRRVATELAALLDAVEVRLTVRPDDAAPTGVMPIRVEGGLGRALAEADLVVCAGGVTLLESLYLGRPTVAVVVAENQRRNVAGAVQQGAAHSAELDDAARVAAALAFDAAARDRLSRAGRALGDGQGPRRVAQALLGPREGARSLGTFG
jgi:spore coat polysaccharide biosynthesis predicted glycosyltransferase SpsG